MVEVPRVGYPSVVERNGSKILIIMLYTVVLRNSNLSCRKYRNEVSSRNFSVFSAGTEIFYKV